MGNYSKQRQEIIKVIEQMNKISSAEEIYYKVKQIDSAISKSTVYRNLIYFVDNRYLMQISIPNEVDRYFYNNSDEDYGFVICEKCGKIQSFICNFDISSFKENIFIQTKANIFRRQMLLKGICEDCILK